MGKVPPNNDAPMSPELNTDKSSNRLSLFDSTCLIVGIIIGSGIYETPTTVAGAVDFPWQIFALWILGGIISFCGALCYAELATTYPESGGDLVYLNRAYGRWAGFLFGWLNTFVARPGDISLMALVFAHYVYVLSGGQGTAHPIWPAIAIVVLLTAVNIIGLRFGKSAQNILTVSKVIGLFAIIGFAFMGSVDPSTIPEADPKGFRASKGVALIVILFTYGGWNEMVYVASEVKDPRRNISRAILLGTGAVMLSYLLANAAFLYSLTLPGMAQSKAIATDAVSGILPRGGQMLVAAVIAISSAGALNGLILTGARITGAMKSYSTFAWLGEWDARLQTPVRALVLEGAIAILVICIARDFKNALIYTSAAVYTFYLATSLSAVVLRKIDPNVERPFRMPLFPLPIIVFACGCICAVISAAQYKPIAGLCCVLVLAVGAIVYVATGANRG